MQPKMKNVTHTHGMTWTSYWFVVVETAPAGITLLEH